MVHVLKAQTNGAGLAIAIVVARFNDLVTDRLLSGATDLLERSGVRSDAITVVRVPGAFELPLACRWLAQSGRFDAVLALGAVIRGSTDHYDHVCNQASRGILDAGIATSVPVAFGLLTCDTLEQALERAGSKAGNKGADAAAAALEMAALKPLLTAKTSQQP
jgi:6,7-dimethyl-8-ribityllumazine synthase